MSIETSVSIVVVLVDVVLVVVAVVVVEVVVLLVTVVLVVVVVVVVVVEECSGNLSCIGPFDATTTGLTNSLLHSGLVAAPTVIAVANVVAINFFLIIVLLNILKFLSF
jgi:hypothetical protein